MGNSVAEEQKPQIVSEYLSGSIVDKMIRFAIPVALSGIIQQMFSAADTIVVGRYASGNAMAAVGSNGPIIGLLVNLFLGLSLGANVVISQAIGRKDQEQVKKAAHTAILLAVICGIFICILGELIVDQTLHWMAVPDEVFPYSKIYLRILFIGVPFNMLYNFESAIFRSVGNTKTPLVALLISGMANVLLNLVFVIVFGMDADGVALATIISHIGSSSYLFYRLTRSTTEVKISIKDLRIDKQSTVKIVRIGIPAGLQQSMFSVANLVLQTSVNSLGATVMAGSSAAHSMEFVAYFVLNSFGQATVTMIGQNYGAKNYDRCRLVLKRAFQVGMLFTAVTSIFMFIVAEPLMSLYNDDPEIVAYAVMRIRITVAFEVIEEVVNLFSAACRGFGHSMWPAIFAIVGICGVRILWAMTVFQTYHTLQVLLAAYPISWAVNGALVAIYYFILAKKVLPKGETAQAA